MQKIDEQIQRCAQWFNECRQLIGRYSIQVPLRRIEEFLEQNRVRFDRKGEKANLQLSFFKHLLSQTEIYRTALENIRRIIDGMKQSNDRTAPLNYDWIDDQFRQSNDNFEVRHWLDINKSILFFKRRKRNRHLVPSGLFVSLKRRSNLTISIWTRTIGLDCLLFATIEHFAMRNQTSNLFCSNFRNFTANWFIGKKNSVNICNCGNIFFNDRNFSNSGSMRRKQSSAKRTTIELI